MASSSGRWMCSSREVELVMTRLIMWRQHWLSVKMMRDKMWCLASCLRAAQMAASSALVIVFVSWMP